MKEPVDHVLRPKLPWRDDATAITECGYDASKVKAITREELADRWTECGQQRTALLTCMTCLDTARRWVSWADDPRQAIEREISWEQRGRFAGENNRGNRLLFELQAIAELINLHRTEFDAIVARLQGVTEWKDIKAEREKARAKKRTRRQF